ncbi:hypothetical protein B0H16DRAFT_719778 [Mycena metata]|uniref:Uncharacterized protein n=1 Tax=Mycena metata TaxID=1033252 RepID=A0AAD7GS85_9AGAR|nr:hypothetical protein B0H16DRAFT_719778 [Mycena metata]
MPHTRRNDIAYAWDAKVGERTEWGEWGGGKWGSEEEENGEGRWRGRCTRHRRRGTSASMANGIRHRRADTCAGLAGRVRSLCEVRVRAEVQQRGGDGEMRGRKDSGACAGTRTYGIRTCPRVRTLCDVRVRTRYKREAGTRTRVDEGDGSGDDDGEEGGEEWDARVREGINSGCHARLVVYCAGRTSERGDVKGSVQRRRRWMYVRCVSERARVARTRTLRTANFDLEVRGVKMGKGAGIGWEDGCSGRWRMTEGLA